MADEDDYASDRWDIDTNFLGSVKSSIKNEGNNNLDVIVDKMTELRQNSFESEMQQNKIDELKALLQDFDGGEKQSYLDELEQIQRQNLRFKEANEISASLVEPAQPDLPDQLRDSYSDHFDLGSRMGASRDQNHFALETDELETPVRQELDTNSI